MTTMVCASSGMPNRIIKRPTAFMAGDKIHLQWSGFELTVVFNAPATAFKNDAELFAYMAAHREDIIGDPFLANVFIATKGGLTDGEETQEQREDAGLPACALAGPDHQEKDTGNDEGRAGAQQGSS
jgi:hypothetical protein